MGLFEKKYCSVCGGKAGGWLSRCDLAGDKEYMCTDCQEKCSQDLIREGTTKFTPDDMKRHIAYMEMCERIYNDEFEVSDTFDTESGDELIAVDNRHGWWVVNNSEDYGIFRLQDIGEVHFAVESESLDEDEFRGNCPSIRELREIREAMGPDMPMLPPGGKIEKMYVDVEMNDHPWINTVRVFLIKDDVITDRREVRDAYYDAIELLRFLRYLAGTKSDAIEDYA